ncbi:hypothetical protein D3C87_2105910 [compost metagenome]
MASSFRVAIGTILESVHARIVSDVIFDLAADLGPRLLILEGNILRFASSHFVKAAMIVASGLSRLT